nr:ATP-binding protein [Oceanobacter mangrovi]
MSEARDQALIAVQTKAGFLAHMSHEIRTPMNGVLGIITMLLETQLNSRQRELLKTAESSGWHLLGIINDILDFSKIEAGKMQLEPIAVDLPALLEDVLASLQVLAREKQLQLQFHRDPMVPEHLLLDPLRTRQIVTNLISNAIKFTSQGGVYLNLLPAAEQKFILQVRDTGIGISEQQSEQIFEAFGQADNSIGRRFGGTGLGLTITRELVELMGGSIALDSEPGRGSCFNVSLPLNEAPLADNESSPRMEVSLKGYRVLLVDDNEVNQLIARHMLEKLGLTVIAANGGQQALQLLQNNPMLADVILMDLQMPELDGFETAGRIRQLHPHLMQLPIIAMTAHASDEDRLQSMHNGMDEHLAKPINSQRLGAVLREFLVHQSPANQRSTTPLELNSVRLRQYLGEMRDWLSRDLVRVEELALELLRASVPEADRHDVERICQLALDFDLDELEQQLQLKLGG